MRYVGGKTWAKVISGPLYWLPKTKKKAAL